MKKLYKYILVIVLLLVFPAHAQAPKRCDVALKNKKCVNFEWQAKVKKDHVLEKVVAKESGGDPKAHNPRDTDGRQKFGLLQIGEEEFYGWAAIIGIVNPNIWDPQQQLLEWDYAANHGLLRKWGAFVTIFPWP